MTRTFQVLQSQSPSTDASLQTSGRPPYMFYIILILIIAAIIVGSVFFSQSAKTIVVVGPYGGHHIRTNPYRKRNLIIGSVCMLFAVILIIVLIVLYRKTSRTSDGFIR